MISQPMVKNYAYFIVNIIISIINSFSGCMANEFIIIFLCGIEKDTYNQVSSRAISEMELDYMCEAENRDSENNSLNNSQITYNNMKIKK